MAIDPSQDPDLVARIEHWLQTLWTNPDAAAQFAENPAVSLASNNLDQNALNSVDLRHVAGNVASAPGIPAEGRHVLNSFASSPYSNGSPVHEVAHVTREVYHNNTVVQKIFNDNSVHIDNSQTILNNGFIGGDISLDNHSATATGAGSVAAAGGSDVNAATGDHSVANTGGGDVNQANGQGSQVVDGSQVGHNAVGSPGAIQADGTSGGAFNSGVNTGAQVGGQAQDTNVGHDINSADVHGHADGSAIGFGQGDVSNASNNNVHDGAVSGHGPASNVSDNTADHGSGVGGHDASGTQLQDNSTTVDHTDVTSVDHSSDVNLAQDGSHADASQHFQPHHDEVDHSHLGNDDVDHTALHA
jgi:hypothetical protein